MSLSKVAPYPGLLRRATIYKYNPGDKNILISLDLSSTNTGAVRPISVPVPASWTGLGDQFAGGCPEEGGSVLVGQGVGGEWFIIKYLGRDGLFKNINTSSIEDMSRNKLSAMRPGRWLAQTNNVRMFVDPKAGFQAGGSDNFFHVNPKDNIISHNLKHEIFFTEGTRSVRGVIKRDLSNNTNRDQVSSSLDSQEYDKTLFTIGLDPTAFTSPVTQGTYTRNPALVENRELTYEFANSFNFITDEIEVEQYDKRQTVSLKNIVERRKSRADTLSLSSVYPNHLIEIIKGTVVDIYGNILDINRAVLPIGKRDDLTLRSTSDKKSEIYKNIREQFRKSIAFHFEINTRKEFGVQDTNKNKNDEDYNFGRDRSKFSIDIDKEGQFKINVPSSSEVGNIPLMTRYENYSTLFAAQNSSDLDKGNPLSFRKNSMLQDIYLDSFANNAPIKLVSSNEDDGFESPRDRFTDQPIMFGTAYHNIMSVLEAHRTKDPTKAYDIDMSSIINAIPIYSKPVVSDTIIVSGEKANAGGRSGYANFDGSLVFNIGANTIDRQSLWYDFAGGVVGMLGRDKNNISYALRADGDIVIQVGGSAVPNDSRFTSMNNAARAGAFDIRAIKPGVTGGTEASDAAQQTIFRVDGEQGIIISTPGSVDVVARGNIRFKSYSNMIFDAENIMFYPGSGRQRIMNRNGLSI